MTNPELKIDPATFKINPEKIEATWNIKNRLGRNSKEEFISLEIQAPGGDRKISISTVHIDSSNGGSITFGNMESQDVALKVDIEKVKTTKEKEGSPETHSTSRFTGPTLNSGELKIPISAFTNYEFAGMRHIRDMRHWGVQIYMTATVNQSKVNLPKPPVEDKLTFNSYAFGRYPATPYFNLVLWVDFLREDVSLNGYPG